MGIFDRFINIIGLKPFKTQKQYTPQNVNSNGAKNPNIGGIQYGKIITINPKLGGYTIKDWEGAIISATNVDNPRRIKLTEVYNHAISDLHTQSELEVRILQLLSQKFVIRNSKTGEENVEATALLKKSWMRTIFKEGIQSIFYGHSLLMVTAIDEKQKIVEVRLVPRSNVVPETSTLYERPSDSKGRNYTDPDIGILFFEFNTRSLGILKTVSKHVILKGMIEQKWINFGIEFGNPKVYAKTNTRSEAELAEIDIMLEQFTENDIARFPSSVEIEFKQPDNKDSYQVFKEYIDWKEREITKNN